MTHLLDLVVPTYNRPRRVFELIESALKLNMPGVYLVIIDDGSDLVEEVSGLGFVTTQQVCAYFKNDSLIYIRNRENIGLARSWDEYYQKHCKAKYTLSVVDKDVLVDKAPLLSALQKMEADESLCMTVIPLLQEDRVNKDLLIGFDYPKMSNREFISHFVRDPHLQHCASYGVKRMSLIRQAGLPRNMRLAHKGLEDAFGIDIDLVLMLAGTGSVDFESTPHIKRSTLAGATERYPLTFAYTYYQYAKRAIGGLRRKGLISRPDARHYLGNWLLLILRGLVVSYRHVHGTEAEVGRSRIGRHLKIPIHVYILTEILRYRIKPTSEMKSLFILSAKITAKNSLIRLRRVFKPLRLLVGKP